MDPTASSEVEARSKRPAEDDGETARKRPRGGDVKRVAEIVLVLSAMAAVRGGRSPTAEERAMMEEARAKVVAMCEGLAPKDIVPREVIGGMIEDLGISGREQKLGFRPPKMSIAEKLLLTKRKMEESKEFVAHSATYSSQRLQSTFGSPTESRGPQHTARMFPSDKPGHPPISSGGFQPASPLGNVSAATTTPLPYQLPPNEVRSSIASSGLATSNLGRDSSSSLSLPRVERTHFRLDGRPNGSPYPSQVQAANSSVDHFPAKTPTWSLQPQSVSSVKTGPENKVQDHIAARVEGAADISSSRMAPQSTRDQNSRSFVTHTTPGHLQSTQQLLLGNNFQPSSLSSNHNEIGKIVQKLLHPQLPQHPTWNPPSRDYMNKAVTCQICKLTINEVENVLLCDACERGFHLKCLQSYNHKGIPRGEWHCPKCLSLSSGKPLPPKYGRVMRNMNTPKGPISAAGVQPSSEKKVGILDQQKITENGNSDLQGHNGSLVNNHIELASDSKTLNASQVQVNNSSSSIKNVDDKPSSGTYPNNSIKSLGAACGSLSIASSNETSTQHSKISESSSREERLVPKPDPQPPKLSDAISDMSHHLQVSHNPQDVDSTRLTNCAEIPSKNYHDNNTMVKDSEKTYTRGTSDCNLTYDIKRDDQDVAQASSVGTSGTSAGAKEPTGFSSDGLHDVQWIGDVLRVVEEKTFYQSCCINGVSYKVLDHALFHSSNDKLIPFKLQGMWEDSKTRSKWVMANQCYFPSDLPEVVGRPSAPESNEVYESNHDSAITAGLIQGPCEVLPPDKFKEESERRTLLGTEANDGLWPIFLCKWFYDKFNGLFQPFFS